MGNNGILLHTTLVRVVILLKESLRIFRLQLPCQLQTTTS